MKMKNYINIYVVLILCSTIVLSFFVLLLSYKSVDLPVVDLVADNQRIELLKPSNALVKRDPFMFDLSKISSEASFSDSIKQEMKPLSETVSIINPHQENQHKQNGIVLVGTLLKEGLWKAFILFEDNMCVVGTGGLVNKQYRILDIKSDYVEIRNETDGRKFVLPMSGTL